MSMRERLRQSGARTKGTAKPRKRVKGPAAPLASALASAPARKRKVATPRRATQAQRTAAREFASGVVAALHTKIKRQKGDPSIVTVLDDSDILSEVTEWIPTGFLALDTILGGGWPVGRCIEVFGDEGSGKSALTHMAIRACQEAGGTVLFIDCETSLAPAQLRQLGIDGTALIYCNPPTLEDVWMTIYALLEQLAERVPDAPTLVVWDSIATATPRKLLEAEPGDVNVALMARSMSENCPKVMRQIAKVRASLLWVNQERTKIGGTGYGPKSQTAGGRAVKYASSVRVRCARVATLKRSIRSEQVRTGYAIQVTTVKNRLYPPHRKTTWILDFKAGPSPELTMLDHLKYARVIKAAGAALTARVDGAEARFTLAEWPARYREDADFRAAMDAAYEAKVLAPLRIGTRDEGPESGDSDAQEGSADES